MKLIQHILLFLSATSVVVTFTIQVALNSQYGALVPHILLLSAVFIKLLILRNNKQIKLNNPKLTYIIFTYCLLVIINGYFQLILNLINLEDYLASIVNYAFPVLYYFYFSINISTGKEKYYFLLGITIAGLLSTLFYIWDTYQMTLLGNVGDIPKLYLQYSAARVGVTYDIVLNNWKESGLNPARISPGYRSHGLQQQASVSAEVVAITGFILLCYNINRKKTFSMILIVFFSILMIIQNLTAIFSFLMTISLVTWGARLHYTNHGIHNLYYVIKCFIISITILLICSLFLLPDLSKYIINQLNFQLNFTLKYSDEKFYFTDWLPDFLEFSDRLPSYYPALIFGDGFSTFGIAPKGGDYGFVESFYRFGPVIFIILIIILLKHSLRAIKLYKYTKYNFLLFPAMLILYNLFSEIHYTSWASKAILPLIFFSFTFTRQSNPLNISNK
jgi:hypothetical protein